MHRFRKDISAIELPRLFTWPFHYEPHPLSRLAAQEVQQYLATQSHLHSEIAEGKMFGVLVVMDGDGGIGFLAAFSGNLCGTNNHEYFVPPIYDMLRPGEFFRIGEAEISAINRHIDKLTEGEAYCAAHEALLNAKQHAEEELSALRALHRVRKEQRDRRRAEGESSETLILESQRDNADMQRLKRHHKARIAEAQQLFDTLSHEVAELKRMRQQKSAELQMRLFAEFRILNARGEVKDLCELFAPTAQGVPPAGAGECAAPKLLQYAYRNNLTPICMAEFWMGASPRGEVRHDGAFYPACNGKCKPILTFMLEGLEVEPNPLLEITPPEPRILWEDEWLLAIDKPCGMLSVEGKSGVRSVERWAKERYPEATGPMIIHRLDQSTSGILLLAKDKDTHKAMQEQFITRSISKRYTALLEGVITAKRGRIELPMRLDYDNRPRQMVAADGKSAITEYDVVEVRGDRTLVSFYPITGRTHQLRLHAAHSEGLNAPIVGDNIYGRECHTECSEHRLCLHASMVEFAHPSSGKTIRIECEAEF
ncbi:MAG: RNA pseudouridine synthase [Alistipes sp.]|nr:RNA pseudouridine synthase [Alistipes sp.]